MEDQITAKNVYQISNGFTFLIKYFLPYGLLTFLCIMFYSSLIEGDILKQYFSGFGIAYVSLINLLICARIKDTVLLEADSHRITGKNLFGRTIISESWYDLVAVSKFLHFYTVLKFRNGKKIRFRPAKYIPILDEDDAEDVIKLLKKLAFKNQVRS